MQARTQLYRYVVVGLASNAVIYLFYIILTRLGVGPKLAMSLLYGVGVLQTFVFNRNWSFKFYGDVKPALVRYSIAYAIGYVINFLALMFLTDFAGFDHQIIQGLTIIFVAALLFLAQRYWVFSDVTRRES